MQGELSRIITQKKFILNALFFGPKKPKNIFIHVHGLAGNLFSHTDLFEKIIDKDTGVLAFNNRGSSLFTRVKKINSRAKKGYTTFTIGAAHEVFIDCVDDIAGAIKYAKSLGAKNIFLIGHSTGCQKIIYYLSKNPKEKIKGAILLAPMSDYADVINKKNGNKFAKALAFAKKMFKEGRKQEVMPAHIWPFMVDAQRFLSLYTKDSIEEIFTYASGKQPKILQKVSSPILVVLAEKDEYRDRPVKKIASWFANNIISKKYLIKIIKNSNHSFFSHESEVSKLIKKWAKEIG